MVFVLGAVLGALAVGGLLGGTLRRLEAVHLADLRPLGAAVAVQVVAAVALDGVAYALAMIFTLGCAVWFVLRNPGLSGRGLLVAGLALNALVISANGAMPVRAGAADRAGIRPASIAHDPRHELESATTRAPWLDDRIPLPLPAGPQVLSFGDLLVAAGVGLLLVRAMRRATHAPTPIPVRPPAAHRRGHSAALDLREQRAPEHASR